MDPFSRLVDHFVRFPGVGSRQAKRFVYFLLSQDHATIERFMSSLEELKRSMGQCRQCYRYFALDRVSQSDLCAVCAGKETDHTSIMIVEKDVDIETIKRTGAYLGRFFVFGGLIPLVPRKSAPRVRLQELSTEIERATNEDGLTEIIFGLTVSLEGEHTRAEILSATAPLIEQHHLKVTTLGRGLSTGTELEYSDEETLKSALKNRYENA